MHSQCKFGEESGSRHSLLVMTEKFKKSVDKGNDVFGALQTNLSNPYQTALIAHFWLLNSLHLEFYYVPLCIESNSINQNNNKKTEIVRGLILNLVHPSLRFNFYLILIWLIAFTKVKTLMLQVMLMTQHPIHLQQTYVG